MERLTERDKDGFALQKPFTHMGEVVDRLAAYEDTGLTPDEISKMATMKIVEEIFDDEFGTPEQRLKEYEDAEEQGLLRLPCRDFINAKSEDALCDLFDEAPTVLEAEGKDDG